MIPVKRFSFIENLGVATEKKKKLKHSNHFSWTQHAMKRQAERVVVGVLTTTRAPLSGCCRWWRRSQSTLLYPAMVWEWDTAWVGSCDWSGRTHPRKAVFPFFHKTVSRSRTSKSRYPQLVIIKVDVFSEQSDAQKWCSTVSTENLKSFPITDFKIKVPPKSLQGSWSV